MHIQKVLILHFIWISGLCLFLDQPALAQDPVFNKFTEEEGLPGNDVYDILQADDRLMWFATDNGVGRYNGQAFQNFNVNNGLPINSIVKLYKDKLDRIWFLGYNGMLSYYDRGEVYKYQYNDSIVKYFRDNYFSKIYVDSSGGVLLSPRQGGYGYISSEGKVIVRNDLIPSHMDSCYLSFEDKGDDYFFTIVRKIPKECDHEGRLFYSDSAQYLRVGFTPRQFQRHFIDVGGGAYLLSYRNCIYYIKDHKVLALKSFKEEVLSILLDRENNLWVSVKYDHGIYKFENMMFDGESSHFFDGYTITSITQDSEGDFWLGTEGFGVFFLPSFDFNLFTLPGNDRNLNVMALEISGNRLWFSTRDKSVYGGRLSKGIISDIRQLDIGEPFDWIKHICVDSKGYLWLSSTEHLRYDPAGFPFRTDTVMNSTFLARGLGDTMVVASRKFGIYHHDKLVYLSDPDSSRRVYAAYHEQGGGLWLGTLYGLYLFTDKVPQFKGELSPFLSERISCISKVNDMLVVGTSAHGLLFLKSDSLVYHFTPETGLIGSSVKCLFIQDDSIIWVGTKDGLNRISFTHDNTYEIESYGQSDGLPSNEINSIGIHEDFVWLATGRGLVSFDPKDLNPHLTPPFIQISGFQINGRDTCILEAYNLAHDQNNIRISFAGISYRSGEELRYRYMLSNYNTEIIHTKNQWAIFPNLPPGEYTFFVNVGNMHDVWNDVPRRIDFRIRQHFTQTIWFMIMIILLSSSVVILITLFFQRQKKIKENARNDLVRMEQKLFRLQMNPHFVFNALLAIQGFMYMNKPSEAGRYLTSFAKLIRHTLYGSSEEFISLDKEIEALQYYLDLQRLRFNDHFNFEIHIDDELIPESTLIPPLLIQPFLENAIEHGLQHKEEEGWLKLKMGLLDDCILVEVEDNGIGREQAGMLQEKKDKLHKSMGLEIISKRVESMNKIMNSKIKMEIIDLIDQKGISSGTLVKICIPFKSS